MATRVSCGSQLMRLNRCLNCMTATKRSIYRIDYRPPGTEPGKYPYLKKRVPPQGRLSFSERIKRLAAEKVSHPDLSSPIDIGLPEVWPGRHQRAVRRRDAEAEEAARTNSLLVPLDDVDAAAEMESGPESSAMLCRHFGVFRDLFREPHFFLPRVPLELGFVEPGQDAEAAEVTVLPVHHGNVIAARDAGAPPLVRFPRPEAVSEDALWTLVMSAPDEHLEEQEKEYLHWMVTNIAIGEDGFSDMLTGEEVCPYLPPIPPRNTGFHRYVFVLYHQQHRVDLTAESRKTSDPLALRTFSSYDFYREHQEALTPAGVAFFQSSWDASVKGRFHHLLDMKEPVFEFSWPLEHREPQERFPTGEAFDKYLDKYRDIRDINEEVLKEHLKLVHPFKDYPEPLKYPMAVPYPKKMPTWWRERERQKRLRVGMWKDLP